MMLSREGRWRIAACLLLVALTLPGWMARGSDLRLVVTDGAQGLGRYAPASAYGVDMIERLGVPLKRAPRVGRLNLKGMSEGRAALRSGAGDFPTGVDQDKEAWVFGVLREILAPGFNAERPLAELFAPLKPEAEGGPPAALLDALGVNEVREGGAHALDRIVLRNLWTFQRRTLQGFHTKRKDDGPGRSSAASPDPYGFLLRGAAAGVGIEFGPLGSRVSDRLVILPGAATLWRGTPPAPEDLVPWSWAWAWGLGAELGLRKGPGVTEVELAVGVPLPPSLLPDDLGPVEAALGRGFAEGYSYASWLDWVGPEDAVQPEVQVTFQHDEELRR
jgi:hypothetical protein